MRALAIGRWTTSARRWLTSTPTPRSRATPDPWDFMPTPADRPGPPWAMAEMIAAEPGLAAGSRERVVAGRLGRGAGGADPRRGGRGRPVVVTGCGTSEHAAMAAAADPPGRVACRPGCAGAGPVAAQAFELALDPPAGGLVIGISHEGGTTATIAAMAAARRTGRDGADHRQRGVAGGGGRGRRRSRRSRWTAAGATPSATCRRSSPRAAAAAASRGGAPVQAPTLGTRLLAGHRGRARRAARRDPRPDEAIAATVAAATHLLVVGLGRGPGHRPRARAQGRGGRVGAVGDPRPRDVPPRPPAGDRRRDRARRSSSPSAAALDARAKRARQALAAAAVARDPRPPRSSGLTPRRRSPTPSRPAAGSSSRRRRDCSRRRRRCSARRARSSS